MMKSILTAVTVVLGLAVAMSAAVAHERFAAGEPGDPKQPARVVKVIMREDGNKMLFEPAYITVRKGEQIRFILNNDGTELHEFVLATVAENRKHAQLMKKHQHMEHDDPNARRLTPFTEGTFGYACLIPGHHEAGMHGMIDVK